MAERTVIFYLRFFALFWEKELGTYSFPEGPRLAHAQSAWRKAQPVDGEDGGGNGLNGLEVLGPKATPAMANKLGPIEQGGA
jgi:hypothetical protein